MTTIIAFYLVLQIIISILFKRDFSIIGCGLGGFSAMPKLTEEQKRKVWQNMKMIGLALEERGKDSCGLYINGELYKGFDGTKEEGDTSKFKDFIAKHKKLKYEGGAIILHTRQATMGSKSAANAHPFHIVSHTDDPKNDLIWAHNGVITNMHTLGGKHKVAYNEWNVDSQGLGMMIDRSGMEVLNEYEGKAALIWAVAGDPNALYIYHGMFCDYKDDPVDKAWEERPLYYLQTKEGVYFSSLQNSLEAIAEDDEKAYCLLYNDVRQVKNGKFTKFTFPVDNRLYGPNTKEKYVAKHYNNYNFAANEAGAYSSQNTQTKHFYETHEWNSRTRTYELKETKTDLPTPSAPTALILNEGLPLQSKVDVQGGRIFFWIGRFHVPDYKLATGCYILNGKGFIVDKDSPNGNKYYFYKGVMLKGEISYQEIVAEDKKILPITKDVHTCLALYFSKYSLYPVTCYGTESMVLSNYARYGFYKDGKRIHSPISFSVKFSSRHYCLDKDGFLTNITSSDRKDINIWYKKPEEKTEPQKTVYDIIYKTEEELIKNISQIQMKALIKFCKNYLDKSSKLNVDEAEAQEEVMGNIAAAVRRGITLRAEIEDYAHVLEIIEKELVDKASSGLIVVGKNRFVEWKKTTTGQEFRSGFLFDNLDNLWISATYARKNYPEQFEEEPTKEKSPNISSDFEVDSTLRIHHYVDGVPHTIDNEIVLEDADNYKYVLRKNKHVYFEVGNEELIRESLSLEEEKEVLELENEEITNCVLDIITALGDINNSADTLAEKTDNLYAQDVATRLYRLLDNVKHGLVKVSEHFDIKQIAEQANRTLNSKISI